MPAFVENRKFEMCIRVTFAGTTDVLFNALDSPVLAKDHSIGLSDEKEEVRASSGKLPQAIQISFGALDLVSMAQGTGGIDRGQNVLWVGFCGFNKQPHRFVIAVCYPQSPRALQRRKIVIFDHR